MATLPTGGIAINAGVEYRRYPSLTWSINRQTMRIDGYADQLAAVQQAADIILNTERFRWQIYQAFSGVLFHDLLGQDPGFVAAELKRRAKEALSMDDRILGISDFSYQVKGDALVGSFRINTVYGLTDQVEVTIG